MTELKEVVDTSISVINPRTIGTYNSGLPIEIPPTIQLRFTDSSYVEAGTLGNLLSSKIRVEIDNLFSPEPPGTFNYLFSQANSSGNFREFALIRNGSGSMTCIPGGIGDVFTITTNIFGLFGSLTIEGDFSYEYDFNTGVWEIRLNKRFIIGGTDAAGSNRVADEPFRLGARQNGEAPIGQDTKFGDTRVYIDDVLVLNYVMPGAGNFIKDTKGTNNGFVLSFNDAPESPADNWIWVTTEVE